MSEKGEISLSKDDKERIFFVTTNVNKFREAEALLKSVGIKLEMLKMKLPELQSDDLKEIAIFSAKHALRLCKRQILVEDAGLSIRALKGFPGPYSSYVFRTIGNRGILKLMEGVSDRSACFQSVIVYCSPTTKPVCFEGKVEGTIALQERGTHGFGFDPIFIPLSDKRTFAEMPIEDKNKYSHRAAALKKFIEWLLKRSPE